MCYKRAMILFHVKKEREAEIELKKEVNNETINDSKLLARQLYLYAVPSESSYLEQ